VPASTWCDGPAAQRPEENRRCPASGKVSRAADPLRGGPSGWHFCQSIAQEHEEDQGQVQVEQAAQAAGRLGREEALVAKPAGGSGQCQDQADQEPLEQGGGGKIEGRQQQGGQRQAE